VTGNREQGTGNSKYSSKTISSIIGGDM